MLCIILCPTQVLHHYKEEGFDFLLKAFNSPNYLEDLTGLSQLYAQTFDDQVSITVKLEHIPTNIRDNIH